MNPAIHIRSPRIEPSNDGTRVTFLLDTPDGAFHLFYHFRGCSITTDTTAAVAAALLPAMRQGWSIQTDGAVSARMLNTIPDIESILNTWDTQYAKIPVQAANSDQHSPIPEEKRGTGVFFSGGLDSFYTFLKNRSRINMLIFVLGFDVALDDKPLGSRVISALRSAATQFNLPLIEVETNLRQFTDRYAHWDLAHGAALASVGLQLAGQLHTLYIPASDSYADLEPNGSHPLLDPLWSTEDLRIIHDGCEAHRVQKAALIAQSDVALQTLRVCWQNPNSAYNCGRCEKCLRTMVNLQAVGALEKCTTFEIALDHRRVAALRMGDDAYHVAYWRENLAAIRQKGTDPRLEKAIQAAIRKAGPLRRLLRLVRWKYMHRDS